jgi:hypothetical protein
VLLMERGEVTLASKASEFERTLAARA